MKLKISVHGVTYEVEVEILDAGEELATLSSTPKQVPKHPQAGSAPLIAIKTPGENPTGSTPSLSQAVNAPIAGSVIEVSCKVGDKVAVGQTVVVIEAMKMKTDIAAACAGTVSAIKVAAGDNVREGQTLVEFA
jgi:biotin carboxyl carrier protein